MRKEKAQSEMVGFVLIVGLVMVALVVFLVIAVNSEPEEVESVVVENMLDSFFRYTTDCAIVFEPQYDTVEDLIKSCYEGKKCNNLDKVACHYMNETVESVLGGVMETEATIGAWQLDIIYKEEEEEFLYRYFEGNCTGALRGAQRNINSGRGDLIVRLKVCDV